MLEITAHPQNQSVATNSMVILKCTSSVPSNVTFSWTHNGNSITTSASMLTIMRVKRSDAGSYACTVSHGPLSVMSNTAILTVYGMYHYLTHCINVS